MFPRDSSLTGRGLLEGRPIAGRYLIREVIGEGGMGSVYRASDPTSGCDVAIKVLSDGVSDERSRDRFRREAELLADLRHPGIVAHLDHGFIDGEMPYLVMEWIEGENLRSCLRRGPLSAAATVTVLARAAAALSGVHARGVIHRDIKPSNLMLRGGRHDDVALIDFGIAREGMSPSQLTKTGVLIGTPEYMAPEQARGVRRLAPSVDVFSLGCVAFECLVGTSPFAADHVASILAKILFDRAPDLREVVPEIPVPLAELIGRMLEPRPEDRYLDSEAVLEALRGLPSFSGGEAMTLETMVRPVAEVKLFSIVVVSGQAISHDETVEIEGVAGGEGDEPVTIARNYGGQAEYLVDGSVVAAFSSGSGAVDRTIAAARCALTIRERWPSFRVVVATGRAHVESGLAVGEVVERAHELIDISRSGTVLVDELSSDLLDGRFDVDEYDGTRVLLREGVESGAPRHLLGKPIGCFGRAHELGILDLTLRSVVDEEESHLVILSGEAGCGKSRLRHEFVRRCAQLDCDPLILYGAGDAMTVGSPHAVIGRALVRAANVIAGTDPEVQRLALVEWIRAWVEPSQLESIADFLAVIAGIELPERSMGRALRAAKCDPNLMHQRCERSVLAVLGGVAATRPVLLIAEDLHWGDQLTNELILRLHAKLSELPLMIVCFARPEAFERFPELERELERGSRRQHLRIKGLGRGASKRLIREALGGIFEPTPTLVDRLITLSSGNVLYLEELIRAVASGGIDNFPTTVVAMLQARMEGLDTVVRRTLLAASVCGQSFSAADLERLLDGISTAAVRRSLEELIRVEMIEVSAEGEKRGYSFRHALLRDAAYQLLSPDGAAQTHAKIAGCMIEEGVRSPIRVAEHLSAAGAEGRAASYYLEAAEMATGANALGEALRRANRGLACGPTGSLVGFLSAIQVWVYGWQGQWSLCVPLAEATLPLLETGSRWWCRCISLLISVGLLCDDDTLMGWAEAFIGAQPHESALVTYLDAANMAIGSAITIGRYRFAARFARRAEEVAASCTGDNQVDRLLAFARAQILYCVELDIPGAQAAAYEASMMAIAVGDGRYRVFSGICGGYCLLRLGDKAAAIDAIRAEVREVEVLGNEYLKTYATVELANALLESPCSKEESERALELVERIIDEPTIPAPYPGWARLVRARGLLELGSVNEALAEARGALVFLAGAPSLRCRCGLVVTDAYMALGDFQAAVLSSESAWREIEEEGGWELLEALGAVIAARRALGDEAGALAATEILAELRCRSTAHEPS